MTEGGTRFGIVLGDATGESTDAADESRALVDADGMAGIQQVEGVGAVQYPFVGGQGELRRQQRTAVFFCLVEALEKVFYRSQLKIIAGLLHFVLMKHISVEDAGVHTRS